MNPRSRPLRVVLFTDTLGDVNGVSRFIQNLVEQARAQGKDLHVITSTRFTCPDRPTVHNLRPRLARPMPGYPTLDVVWPDAGAMRRLADRLDPDVVHVSTPGPVGAVGRRWALKRGLPVLGTYHTDFPAYIAHLFDDPVLTWMTTRSMQRFYRPMSAVFTRSEEYAKALEGLGVRAERVRRLIPGIDTSAFDRALRPRARAAWAGIDAGVRPESVKVLYVGRVSVEKNLPMLTRVWPRALSLIRARGVDAQLLIVGDGPYRAPMQRELSDGASVVFLGFRHGVELATIYAGSDVFAFPSTTDTLGQVVMEAQCAGLPVLVTDQGGPSEVVDDGLTGHVLPASPAGRAIEVWSTALAELVCDHAKRERMGAAAHAKIAPMSIAHSFADFWQVHEEADAEARALTPARAR